MKSKRLCNECGKPLPEEGADDTCPTCLFFWGLSAPEEHPAGQQAGDFIGARPQEPPSTRLANFGDFELLEEIARGGMGVVYKARQISLNRMVAVKIILAGQFAANDARQRFKWEAEAAARLRHPNIVGVHEVGEQEGFPYFSMDYIDGKNLEQIARERPITPSQTAEWVRVIAEAIHYAHGQNVLHRDLKPSNILIDSLNVPHVTDFGLAKHGQEHLALTISGEILGSPNYMPPEQTGVRRGELGRTSDVYALGAILYHLLTGRPPFAGETIAGTIHQVVHNDVIPPRILNPPTPRDLETICLKCLEKEPSRRFQTAQELAAELGRFLKNGPILSSNEFIIEVLVRKYQLHLPVYRQCAALAEDHGIDLSRKTLNDGILAAGSLLGAIVRAQQLELLAGGYIQADETTMPCQTGEKTGRNHRAFIWEFSRPGGVVIFDFQMGRGRDGPREFLKGFRGKLQSDGYKVADSDESVHPFRSMPNSSPMIPYSNRSEATLRSLS